MSPVPTTPTGVVLADGEGGGGLMGVDYNVVGDVLYVVANNLKSQPSRNTSSSAALAERQVIHWFALKINPIVEEFEVF